eukprot:JP446217.1.p1 GENE.JP446217.1~~JP446217.1.p1  ORF type:complete len:290 (-),score=162.02 JP446217.1:292-1161(-)
MIDSGCKADSAAIKKMISLMKTLLAKLQAELANAIKADKQSAAALAKAKADLAEAQKKYDTQVNVVKDLQKQKDKMDDKVTATKVAHETAKKALDDYFKTDDTESLSNQKAAIEEIIKMITKLQNLKAEDDTTDLIEGINSKLTDLQKASGTEFLSMSRDHKEAATVKSMLEEMLKDIKKSLAENASTQAALSNEVSRQKKILADRKAKHSAKLTELGTAKETLKRLEKDLAKAKGKHAERKTLYERLHPDFLDKKAIIEKEIALVKQIIIKIKALGVSCSKSPVKNLY